MNGDYVLCVLVEPSRGHLTKEDENVERWNIVVPHGYLLHLVIQQLVVVVSIAALLKCLAQIEYPELAVVSRRQKASKVSDVVAVGSRIDTRYGSCNLGTFEDEDVSYEERFSACICSGPTQDT